MWVKWAFAVGVVVGWCLCVEAPLVAREEGGQVGVACNQEQRRLAAEYDNRELSVRSVGCSEFVSGPDSEYFLWVEFAGPTQSNDGEGVEYGKHFPWGLMAPRVVAGLNEVRRDFGAQLVITSGYRCAEGNGNVEATVGSDPGSSSPHIFGKAVDFRPTGGGLTEEQHAKLLEAVVRSRGTVPRQYGEYSDTLTHIHASW